MPKLCLSRADCLPCCLGSGVVAVSLPPPGCPVLAWRNESGSCSSCSVESKQSCTARSTHTHDMPRHMDASVTEHALLHGQLLHHHRPGKGRRGDAQLLPLSHCRLATIARRSTRPHVAPDLCNGLYRSPTIPVWFNRVGTPTHGISSLIVSPFLRWAQPHAVAAVPDDALRLDQSAVRSLFTRI
jgi:hypothetical protein